MIPFSKLPFPIDKVFLTSDTHAYHKNICLGITSWTESRGESGGSNCRNFPTLEDMNSSIVKGINDMVEHDDLLIHLGDWSFGGAEKVKEFRDRINCRNIILLQGNHDHNIEPYRDLFLDYLQIGYFQVESLKFVCSHFPFSIWHQSHKDVPSFYGHVHGSFKNVGKSLDVGVDNVFKLKGKYEPLRLQEAYNIAMKQKTFLESHHNKNTN